MSDTITGEAILEEDEGAAHWILDTSDGGEKTFNTYPIETTFFGLCVLKGSMFIDDRLLSYIALQT